jgi:hypothetical protein
MTNTHFESEKKQKIKESIKSGNMTTFCYIVMEQIFTDHKLTFYKNKNSYELAKEIADEYWGENSSHEIEEDEIDDLGDWAYESFKKIMKL